jgi:hypothetical protein
VKLKVGDIEMDSAGGIRMCGEQVTEPGQTFARPGHPEHRLMGMDWPALPSAVYTGLGVISLVAATLMSGALLLGSFPQVAAWALAALLPWVFLVGAGGLLLGRRQPNAPGLAEPPTLKLMENRARQIAALLSRAENPMTVEQIAAGLKWTEDASVTGLKLLVVRQEVTEDLDLNDGAYTYALRKLERELDAIDRKSTPIDERARALNNPKTEPPLDPDP